MCCHELELTVAVTLQATGQSWVRDFRTVFVLSIFLLIRIKQALFKGMTNFCVKLEMKQLAFFKFG